MEITTNHRLSLAGTVCYLRSTLKLMTNKANAPAVTSAAGLRGVFAASSSISDVNGEKGELIYQGYNIHDLAKHSTFEEVIFLLWNKRLPTSSELSELEQSLRASYEVPGELIALMKQFPREADPIDVLRTAISALEFYDPNARDVSREASVKDSHQTYRAVSNDRRRLGSHSPRTRAGTASEFFEYCRKLSLHAPRREAFGTRCAHI